MADILYVTFTSVRKPEVYLQTGNHFANIIAVLS